MLLCSTVPSTILCSQKSCYFITVKKHHINLLFSGSYSASLIVLQFLLARNNATLKVCSIWNSLIEMLPLPYSISVA